MGALPKAIYFERTIRGARNVWRLGADPDTLRAVESIERLTTGPGMDTEPSLSPDGKRVAFTGESRQIRVWSFPSTPFMAASPGPASR